MLSVRKLFAPILGDKYSKHCELLKNIVYCFFCKKIKKGGENLNYPKNRYEGIGPWRNKDWLYREYVVKNKSSKRIAEENGCKQSTIQQWLRTFNIKEDSVSLLAFV